VIEGRRVLVIDDDDSVLDTIDMALSDEGYEVRAVSDGAVALSLLDAWGPSVILLDMKMPGMDGWAFSAEYQQRPEPRPPVVVVTAARDAVRWAAEVKADALLPKPFDLDSLLKTVSRFTNNF